MDGIFWNGGFIWPFYFMIFFFFAFVIALAFWVWMVIDCATRKFDGVDKVVWILILIFLNILGAFIYFLAVYIRKDKAERVERVQKTRRRRR